MLERTKMKKKKNYMWSRKPKNAPDANTASKVFKSIKKKRGGITPQLLVIESKKKDAPFHNCFEWDDSKGAEKYRIVQACEILRCIKLEIEPDEEHEESRTVRALIAPSSIEREDSTSYATIEEVRNDEELNAAYMRQLKRELDAVKNKIKSYKIFSAVVEAIEAIKI